MVVLIIVTALICFGIVAYESKFRQLQSNNSGLAELFLVSVSVSFILYVLFFQFADYIRSFNLKYPSIDFIPPVRPNSKEFDGIEGYTLYALMFVNILLSFIVARYVSGIKNRIPYLILFVVLTLLSVFYFVKTDFIPPMSNMEGYGNKNVFIPIVFLTVSGLLYLLQKRVSNNVLLITVAVILLPVCFIATSPISMVDYSYVLSPALRLLNGVPLSDIYFQYDLFLSLIPALWMKLNIDLKLLEITAQLSYYLLFIGMFIFSKKYFANKNLPVFLLITVVLIRFYAVMTDASALYQVTPLRLELWFIVLLLVYYKGVYHWSVALTLGILLLLHRNFGLIYFLSYIQLIFTLFIVEYVQVVQTKKMEGSSFVSILKNHLLLNYKNVLIIMGCIVASLFLFKGFIPESALIYQKIGVGMIQISTQSFFWYISVLFSLTFVLLLLYKNKLTVTYFNTGLLIIYFAIGNSIYFFGRSHEHNILNLATSFVFVAFLFFDLLNYGIPAAVDSTVENKKTKKANPQSYALQNIHKARAMGLSALPLILIAGSAYYFSEQIGHKLQVQYKNLKKSQYLYPLDIPKDFDKLKRITNNSDKVYFLNFGYDFTYYYYGNYKPVGYFSPCATNLLKKDLVSFMQGLMDQGYYIVVTETMFTREFFPDLKYNKVASDGSYIALSKENVELLLPHDTTTSLAHIGIPDDLGNNGIYLPPVTLNNDFTLELILKPASQQVPNANIVVNALTDEAGSSGFSFQQNGANTNQFIFGYAGGKSWTDPPIFMLNANEWNYVVVAVNKNKITVFNNGVEVASVPTTFAIKNVTAPVVINNAVEQKSQFAGLIREVKIMNDTISLETIKRNAEVVKTKLVISN